MYESIPTVIMIAVGIDSYISFGKSQLIYQNPKFQPVIDVGSILISTRIGIPPSMPKKLQLCI